MNEIIDMISLLKDYVYIYEYTKSLYQYKWLS